MKPLAQRYLSCGTADLKDDYLDRDVVRAFR